jgi:hypothetical protein
MVSGSNLGRAAVYPCWSPGTLQASMNIRSSYRARTFLSTSSTDEARIAQSVQWPAWLNDRGFGVQVPVVKNFLFTSSRPALGPTQPPIQRVPGKSCVPPDICQDDIPQGHDRFLPRPPNSLLNMILPFGGIRSVLLTFWVAWRLWFASGKALSAALPPFLLTIYYRREDVRLGYQYSIYFIIIIIIIIIYLFNCKWVFTRWQRYNNKTTDK